MHMLIICAAAPTTDRPRTHGLLTALTRNGHDVSVIFVDGAGTAFDELSDRCRALLPVARRAGLAERVIEVLARRRFDLVHIEGEVADAVDLPLPLPTVIDTTACQPLRRERMVRRAGWLLRGAHVLQAWRARQRAGAEWPAAARLIVASSEEDWGSAALGHPTHQPEVVPTPVDVERLVPTLQLRERARLLLDLRDFTPLERMVVLMETHAILAHIWQQRPEVRLQVLGPPPPGALRALATEPRISFVGAVRDARPYLAVATLALVPALPGRNGLYTPLEAMAMSLPLLGIPALARELEALAGHELLVASDAEELAQAALTLLDDPRYCGRLGRAARHLVERRHNYAAVNTALENVYARAMGCALAEWRLAVGFEGVVMQGEVSFSADG
ncbi:MAG: glycosyltransferase [Candidatus Viridilinea halotolerans]|uniref:Glycosyltransferase n=1 Tax=Candidatus Viridilinea halotolerans TaxID=2491704 RepID=A0A426UBS7_9CHLR|nr:MAG: glycosyltransferase [Candidatus Viridilinea halotolerans]